MFRLFRRDIANRIDQEEFLVNQNIIDLLGEIAAGKAIMTDAMKQILDLSPQYKEAWERFETQKATRESAINVQVTDIQPRNRTSIITVK